MQTSEIKLSRKEKIEKAKNLIIELNNLEQQGKVSMVNPLSCGDCPSAGDVIESCSIERYIM